MLGMALLETPVTARANPADEYLSLALRVLEGILVFWTLYAYWPVLTSAGGHHGSNLVRLMRVWL